MSNTQKLRSDAVSVTFADPKDPDFTVRFKTTTSKKTLQGIATDNYVTEIIVNDDNPVTLNGQSVTDPLSLRIKVSGAVVSQDRLKTISASIASQLPTWYTENVFLGFEPVTVPVNPNAAK